MLETMVQQFKSFYEIPGLNLRLVLLAIALAIVFAAVWLIILRAWHFNKAWSALILVFSAILTWTCIAFIQEPLQIWTQQFLVDMMGQNEFMRWLLLAGIPLILLSGLVQEAAKLVPVIVFWSARGRTIDPLSGFYAGAIAGAGFGIFEAVWVHNSMFAAGWTWDLVRMSGATAFLGFWERFFSVGLHIGVSALAGYGWAKGYKWQFYLIAAGLHSLSNYGVILLNKGIIGIYQTELYVAILALITVVLAFMMLRNAQRAAEVQTEEKEEDIPLVMQNDDYLEAVENIQKREDREGEESSESDSGRYDREGGGQNDEDENTGEKKQ